MGKDNKVISKELPSLSNFIANNINQSADCNLNINGKTDHFTKNNSNKGDKSSFSISEGIVVSYKKPNSEKPIKLNYKDKSIMQTNRSKKRAKQKNLKY